MSVLDSIIAELEAYKLSVSEVLVGFQFLLAGNVSTAFTAKPLQVVVTQYSRLERQVQDAIMALQVLAGGQYPLLPYLDATPDVAADLADDLKKVQKASALIVSEPVAVGGKITELA
jgi:hypothetical protein